jgi:hypothetical protein
MPTNESRDQVNMETFLGSVVDDYKAGVISREQAIGGLAKVMVALNQGDFEEARRWIEQGRKLVRDLISVEEAALLLFAPHANGTHH